MKKRLSKTKYIEFMMKLTGHSKSFIQKNMDVKHYAVDSYGFKSGSLYYDTWMLDGRIYTQYFLDSSCQGSWYHDFDTLDFDWKYTEEQEEKDRKQMLEE